MELAEATCLKHEGRSNLVTLSLEVYEKLIIDYVFSNF